MPIVLDVGPEAPTTETGDPFRRLEAGRRLSVWHFLVMLVLLPALALSGTTAALARERLEEASAAGRVERELLAIASMDELREALITEGAAGPMTVVAGQLGVPMPMVSSMLGWRLPSLQEAETTTDKAMAAVPRIAPFRPSLARIRAELPSLRAAYHQKVARRTGGVASLTATIAAYNRLVESALDAEQSLAHNVGSGKAGAGNARLLTDTRSFGTLSAVITSQQRRAMSFFHALMVGTQSRADAKELARESERYRVLAQQLSTEVDARTAREWARMTGGEQFQIFESSLARGPAAIPRLPALTSGASTDLSAMASMIPMVRAVMSVVSQLSELLQRAAQDGAAAARSDAADARARTAQLLAGIGLMFIMLIVALFVIGGLLRRRLNDLAQGAQRLSAGLLEPVAVHGPRELAATGEALNAAVASLRHIEAKAMIVASGDLDSPELEQPAPGPLGAAVHASVSRIVTVAREREELRRELSHQASHDALTGLPNRAELDRTLAAALTRAQRSATPVTVLFVDLDRFKACNDRYGHAAGDHVLQVTAQRLQRAVRPGDVVGRLGGDEFVVIIEGTAPGPETTYIAQRIVAALSRPIDDQGRRITIGASVGLAGRSHGQATADQLLSEADAAVYQAKASGRGRVIVHDQRRIHERQPGRVLQQADGIARQDGAGKAHGEGHRS